MKEIYIYHHLGLGDHIMLNGLVHHISEEYDRTWVFSKPKNIRNVRRIYAGSSNIKIIALDDIGVREFMKIFPMHNYLIVGHTPEFVRRANDPSLGKTFDQLFYEDSNVPFKFKWDKFLFQRELEREKEVYYDILGLKDTSEFAFFHEGDYKPISRETPNMPIIRPDNPNISIFDYLYAIEKAKEVHVANSSFMNLIDCIQLRTDNIFYHEYSRPGINTVLKLPWKVLK